MEAARLVFLSIAHMPTAQNFLVFESGGSRTLGSGEFPGTRLEVFSLGDLATIKVEGVSQESMTCSEDSDGIETESFINTQENLEQAGLFQSAAVPCGQWVVPMDQKDIQAPNISFNQKAILAVACLLKNQGHYVRVLIQGHEMFFRASLDKLNISYSYF
jgi:hypothetical protein